MPDAARIGDNHTCPVSDPSAHVGGPILTGETTVLIADMAAARVGDHTAHGGVIVEGCRTVTIG